MMPTLLALIPRKLFNHFSTFKGFGNAKADEIVFHGESSKFVAFFVRYVF